MNHQIQHHVDVRAPRLKWGEPVTFDKPGMGEKSLNRIPDGIEPLNVAHVQHQPFLLRTVDHLPTFVRRDSQRLFDQDVYACIETIQHDPPVLQRRHGDAHRVDFAQQASPVTEMSHTKAAPDFSTPGLVKINHTHQPGLGQFRINTSMMLPKMSHADNACFHDSHITSWHKKSLTQAASPVPLLCNDGNFFRRGKSWEVDPAARMTLPAL